MIQVQHPARTAVSAHMSFFHAVAPAQLVVPDGTASFKLPRKAIGLNHVGSQDNNQDYGKKGINKVHLGHDDKVFVRKSGTEIKITLNYQRGMRSSSCVQAYIFFGS